MHFLSRSLGGVKSLIVLVSKQNLNKTKYIYASKKISYQFLTPWHLFLKGNKAANSSSSDHPLSNCCLISYSSSVATELNDFASKNVFNFSWDLQSSQARTNYNQCLFKSFERI